MGKQMGALLFWTQIAYVGALPLITISAEQGRLAKQVQSESPLHQSLKL